MGGTRQRPDCGSINSIWKLFGATSANRSISRRPAWIGWSMWRSMQRRRLAELTLEAVQQMERLAPFGAGNPRPLLCASSVRMAGSPQPLGKGGRHLSAAIRTVWDSFSRLGLQSTGVADGTCRAGGPAGHCLSARDQRVPRSADGGAAPGRLASRSIGQRRRSGRRARSTTVTTRVGLDDASAGQEQACGERPRSPLCENRVSDEGAPHRFHHFRLTHPDRWEYDIQLNRSHLGAWLSLVERCVRDAEVAGSNPVAPTCLDIGRSAKKSNGFLFSRTRVTSLKCGSNRPRRGSRVSGRHCLNRATDFREILGPVEEPQTPCRRRAGSMSPQLLQRLFGFARLGLAARSTWPCMSPRRPCRAR